MKLAVILGASAIALLSALPSAQAEDGKIGVGAGDVLVHFRALAAIPDESGHDDRFAGSKIGLSNSYVPEVDVSYFFTDNFAAELIAATTRHKVTDNANALNLNLGHVWLLPPTLTAQYHPMPHNAFDPYVGVGVNYSIFYGAGGAGKLGASDVTVSYKNGFGPAFQIGMNYDVSGPWFVNVDVKKIFVSTSAAVVAGGVTTNAKVDVDPLLVGVGVGYRF